MTNMAYKKIFFNPPVWANKFLKTNSFVFLASCGDKKSQHGCVRWALRELRALHEHLTCNHAMILPAAGLRIVFDTFH